MAIFDWMANMAINSAGGGKAVFGSKPGVAEYKPTDLGAEAKRAAASNLENTPGIQALLEKILPGYGEMVAQGAKNTNAMLKGEIPQDVQDRLRRNAAFQSFTAGSGGSGMSKALTARDFGLTSLDLMEKGTNSAQRWAGLTQAGVSPWMVTGRDQGEQTMKNNLYEQATKQFQFNVDAAPDPAAAGLFNTIGVIGGTAASFGLAMMGGSNNTKPLQVDAKSGYGGGQGGGLSGLSQNGINWGSYGGRG